MQPATAVAPPATGSSPGAPVGTDREELLPTAPTIRRRLACFLYEGVLLFGVVMLVGLVYGVTTQQRHALSGTNGLRWVLFVALGLYFVHFWTRSGQTLAMLTWHVRLETTSGGVPPSPPRALLRYLLAWMWFAPALSMVHVAGWRDGRVVALAVVAGVVGYAATAVLHPHRQFWHDAWCGTRLVLRKAPARGPSATRAAQRKPGKPQ